MTSTTMLVEEIAIDLANIFAETAIERDKKGGTPKRERDFIRKSGLLKLMIPTQYGGLGGSWSDVFKITQIFAKVDSSLAHVFAYHFVNVATVEMCGSEEQKNHFYSETVNHNAFWGNAFNPIQIQLEATRNDDGYVLNGVKTFCSGSVDSDYLLVSALYEEQEDSFLAIIPTKRIGIEVKEDWNNMGQRQTDSGSIHFQNVQVYPHEKLVKGLHADEFSKLRFHIASFALNHLYVGIIEGALDTAAIYTREQTRPRSPLHTSAAEDPIIQYHYGQFFAQLEAAKLVVEKADRLLEKLWEDRTHITPAKRNELDVALQTAKIVTTQVGLEITSRIYDVMGSRATASRYGFDRYWRNLRTMTLHVPVDTAIQAVGKHFLENK